MAVLDGANLSGKVALVVGAGVRRSIGFASAEALAAAGASVALADLAGSDVLGLVGQLPQGRGERSGHVVDLADAGAVQPLVEEVVERHGKIDILVQAAAILEVQSFLDLAVDSWDRTFAVNARGVFLACQAVARHLVGRRSGGRIIAIASNVGRIPRLDNAAYAASKAAIIHLVRCMALELGPHDIAVNALCPGSTATSMLIDNQTKGDPRRLEGVIKGSIEQWRTGIPLGRLAEPEDQAATVLFLAGDAGRHITGQAICVDGGQTLF